MAGTNGHPEHSVEALRLLLQEPQRFSLFAALRVLEQADPGRPRLGTARRPADEWVRLEQPPHLSFAPSEISSAAPAAAGRLRVAQFGFGVFGPNGALPFHLTEYAFERARHHEDAAVSDFINLFQHRLASLFYRAWADSDPAACFGRPGDRDDFSFFLGAIVGLWDPSADGRDSLTEDAKRYHAGLLSPGAKSADGLASLLTDYFGQEFKVREFVGSWLKIPETDRTRLGSGKEGAALGKGATLGGTSWQCNDKFEVMLGPISFEAFMQFLPGSRALRAMHDLIRLYTCGEWSWQLRLLVREGDSPGVSLGKIGRLGWTTWLGEKSGIANDVVLHEEAVVAALAGARRTGVAA